MLKKQFHILICIKIVLCLLSVFCFVLVLIADKGHLQISKRVMKIKQCLFPSTHLILQNLTNTIFFFVYTLCFVNLTRRQCRRTELNYHFICYKNLSITPLENTLTNCATIAAIVLLMITNVLNKHLCMPRIRHQILTLYKVKLGQIFFIIMIWRKEKPF